MESVYSVSTTLVPEIQCVRSYTLPVWRENNRRWREANPDRRKAHSRRWREANPEAAKAYNQKYQKTNASKLHEQKRKYREVNRDRVRERERRQREANRETVRENSRRWYAANADKACESRRRYKKANPDKRRVQNLTRRARERNLPHAFTSQDWQTALAYFDGCCAVCGQQPDHDRKMAADHWIPIESPDCPGTVPTNIVPLCQGIGDCNNSKQHRDPLEWLTERYGKRKAAEILARIEAYFTWVKEQGGL